MTKRVILTVAMLVAAIGFAVAAFPQSNTLLQMFAELADLPETNEIGIGIGWMGLSPLSPMTAAYILERHGDQFEGQGTFRVADKPKEKRAVAVPRDLVRAFLVA